MTNQTKIETAPEINYDKKNLKLVGIKGWLLIPAFKCCINPITSFSAIIALLYQYTEIKLSGHSYIFLLELIVAVIMFLFWAYSSILFFRKKRKAPNVLITLFIIWIITDLVLLSIEYIFGADQLFAEKTKRIIPVIIDSLIWIFYFKFSKRVRATFTN